MRVRLAAVLLGSLLSGCVESQPAQTTFPRWDREPVPAMYGPPGGEIDPGYGYIAEGGVTGDTVGEQVVPGACPDGMYLTEDPAYLEGGASGVPGCARVADATAAVSDGEIAATLDGYGVWIDDPEYGRVWRPDATVVGVNFTPYETCGSWVWSDYGWTYQCDWDWGWLPFHYGQWDYFDDGGYWGWVPGDQWSPAWVDWRTGGGQVGWRPSEPVRDHRGPRAPTGPTIRDHRGPTGPTIRDHRTGKSHGVHWTFVPENAMGKPSIRPHVTHDLAEGLSVTQPGRPTFKGNVAPVKAASVMGGRWGRDRATGGVRVPGQNGRPGSFDHPVPPRAVIGRPNFDRPVVTRPPASGGGGGYFRPGRPNVGRPIGGSVGSTGPGYDRPTAGQPPAVGGNDRPGDDRPTAGRPPAGGVGGHDRSPDVRHPDAQPPQPTSVRPNVQPASGRPDYERPPTPTPQPPMRPIAPPRYNPPERAYDAPSPPRMPTYVPVPRAPAPSRSYEPSRSYDNDHGNSGGGSRGGGMAPTAGNGGRRR